MNLTEYQIQAIVDTLEKEHNKFWKEKDKLTQKPPVEKKDKDGLTAKEREFLVAKNKRIRTELSKLSIETKIELQYSGCPWFKNYYAKTPEKGLLESESDTLMELIDNYNTGKETKKYNNADKPKKESGRTFNRADVTRKVTLASIDAQSIDEILLKVRKRENNSHIIAKAKKAVPVKKAVSKKKAAKKK